MLQQPIPHGTPRSPLKQVMPIPVVIQDENTRSNQQSTASIPIPNSPTPFSSESNHLLPSQQTPSSIPLLPMTKTSDSKLVAVSTEAIAPSAKASTPMLAAQFGSKLSIPPSQVITTSSTNSVICNQSKSQGPKANALKQIPPNSRNHQNRTGNTQRYYASNQKQNSINSVFVNHNAYYQQLQQQKMQYLAQQRTMQYYQQMQTMQRLNVPQRVSHKKSPPISSWNTTAQRQSSYMYPRYQSHVPYFNQEQYIQYQQMQCTQRAQAMQYQQMRLHQQTNPQNVQSQQSMQQRQVSMNTMQRPQASFNTTRNKNHFTLRSQLPSHSTSSTTSSLRCLQEQNRQCQSQQTLKNPNRNGNTSFNQMDRPQGLYNDPDDQQNARKLKNDGPSTAIPMPSSRGSSQTGYDSRSSTVSATASSNGINGFGSRESSSSSLLSAGDSFSNLTLGHSYHQDTTSTDTDYTDTDGHGLSVGNGSRRRSSRIKRKRDQGYVTYYHPKSWEKHYEMYRPPSKKAKTSNKTKPKSSLKEKKKKKMKTPIPSMNPQTKSIKSRVQSPSNKLREQNARMRLLRRKLATNRFNWIQHHYSSFRPFLSSKVARRYQPKSTSSPNTTTPSIVEVPPNPSQPGLLCSKYTLRDYQLRSVNWLRSLRENGIPAILADEMGLGKTIQSIATMAALYEDDSINDPDKHCQRSPCLVVCPLSVAEAWRTESEKWLPSKKVVLFHGPKLQRDNLMKHALQFGAFDIVVTTYEMASSHSQFLNKFCWNYLILDEAHRIKNEKTNWHLSLKQLTTRCLHTVLLTGTPIQNNMHELYALLSFMFGDEVFDAESGLIFDAAYDSTNCKQDKKLLAMTPHLIRPFFLRRLKSEVELSLPPKEEIIVKLAMSSEQRKYYKTFLLAHASMIDAVSQTLHGGDERKAKGMVSEWKKLRALYMNLRKIALHPFLLENLWPRVTVSNCQSVIAHSSKLQLLDKLLARLKKEGHRVLLFSCFTMVLDLLEVYCSYRKHRYLRLDGSTSRIRRKIDIMRFNDDPQSPYFMYLISNRAGGLGINLQSADTVIHFDTDWNPQSDLQAQARAHRIGQKKMVKIYRLISKHTVEERILFRSQQKLYLDAVVNQGAKMLQDADDDDDGDGEKEKAKDFDLDDNDLLKCIKFGAHKMMDQDDAEGDDVDAMDLDVLLERSYKVSSRGDDSTGEDPKNGKDAAANEKASRQKMLRDLSEENNVADFDFAKPLVAGNVFEGTTYEKKEFVIGDDVDYDDHKRCSKKRTKTTIIDGMSFEVTLEEDPQLNFYQNCGQQIVDFSKRNTTPWHHEMTRCWGCDVAYDWDEIADAERHIIPCSKCPKTFHSKKCWQGHEGGFGAPQCSQHRCFECGLKTSECGMILRCLGCQMSYCFECAPKPHWSSSSGDGLYFVDKCAVAEHFGFSLPQSTYMYIWCGAQCKKWYHEVYLPRDLPDLALTIDQLDGEMVQRVRERGKRPGSALKDIEVEWRVQNRYLPNKVMDRLQQTMDGSWPIIAVLYDILFGAKFEEEDEEKEEDADTIAVDDDSDQKESKEYILGEHYLMNSTLAKRAKSELTAPQWIMCTECKKWRVIPVAMDKISSGQWMKEKRYIEWQCSKEDGLEELCDSVQSTPNKKTHSEQEVAILRLQRKWMDAKYSNSEKTESESKITKIEHKMETVLSALAAETAHRMEGIGEAEMAEARFAGIGEWRGYNGDDAEESICAFYERLVASFREWRIESLKTLMDHLGFFVEQKTVDRDTGCFKVGPICMSHHKEKVIAKLSTFLMYPIGTALHLKTVDFKK